MRLYQGDDVSVVKLSLEEFNNYYKTASVISQEAISDYFMKVKDAFSTLQSSIILNKDKVAVDSLSNKFETLHILKRIKYIDFKDQTVLKPENFKGKYIDYIQDLLNTSLEIVPNTEASLSNLKLAIASFINEYTEEKVQTLYGASYFKETNKLVEEHTKVISKYFATKSNASKTYVGEVLKSFNDIEQIYNNIDKLENILNLTKIENISKLANEASELVDTLLEQNTKSGILLKNDTMKKELVNAIHICAREVEFVSYLYSNSVFFYNAFKSLTELVNEFGNTNHKD